MLAIGWPPTARPSRPVPRPPSCWTSRRRVAFCCLGYALASPSATSTPSSLSSVIVLPLYFISGIFVPISELPSWLLHQHVFPVHPLAAALLAAYNPYTTASGLRWGDLAILATWGVAGLVVAIRRFSWLPRGG